jgi:pentatricopeptide repeat protein
MIEDGMEPDEVILLRVLSVCSHAGFVEEGHYYLASISKACSMSMTIEHCNCVIDLFSRAGRLDEAVAIFAKMPCEPDLVTWTIILGACQKWSNLELGKSAFEGASSLEMDHPVSFVLLSNIVCQ